MESQIINLRLEYNIRNRFSASSISKASDSMVPMKHFIFSPGAEYKRLRS